MGFPELRRYSVLQVSHDTTVPVVFAAAILVLLGLLAALYTSRRKLWVRVEPAGEGALVRIGGFALQRAPQFEGEFRQVLEAIVRDAGGAPEGAEVVGRR
jgi:cytochrome c biogenesis protein